MKKKIPVVNVRNVKARKVAMIVKGSGGGAKCAKEPVGGKGSRASLLIAPSVSSGMRLADRLKLDPSKTAILTESADLTGVLVYPDEIIYMIMGSEAGFLDQLQTAATMFVPGEYFNLKMYAL